MRGIKEGMIFCPRDVTIQSIPAQGGRVTFEGDKGARRLSRAGGCNRYCTRGIEIRKNCQGSICLQADLPEVATDHNHRIAAAGVENGSREIHTGETLTA
jgi:hypothetical protein